MKCLFIGGIADGEWRDGHPRIFLEVAKLPPSHRAADLQNPVSVDRETYARRDFRLDYQDYTVYVALDLSMSDAFDRLLKGYRPHAPRR